MSLYLRALGNAVAAYVGVPDGVVREGADRRGRHAQDLRDRRLDQRQLVPVLQCRLLSRTQQTVYLCLQYKHSCTEQHRPNALSVPAIQTQLH